MIRNTMICSLLTLAMLAACTKSDFGGGGGYYSTGDEPMGRFDSITENPFLRTLDSAVSTFSVDADGASYAVMRKALSVSNIQSIQHALRTEEFINYFTYDYPDAGSEPIAVNGEVSHCPWNAGNKLIRIGIKGRSVPGQLSPYANFVLLVDVSGSMEGSDRLELLKKGFIQFTKQMRPQDRIAIVTYAGKAGVFLESTPGTQKELIIRKINVLKTGGSTNGSGGIIKAYEIARQNFISNGNNRVILGTDGDFNVGVTSTDALINLIKEKKESGIFLTVLGVGTGNLNDAMMEKLANNGNGNYEYIDCEDEIKKVFIDEYSKFVTVAKDVKVQVRFNPDIVEEYRLIGYENRMLQSSDFDDDKKDAGEIGAGQTITALYEIKPRNNPNFKLFPSFTINFRYKKPNETTSNSLDLDIYDQGNDFEHASENMRFAASLASLGMYMRNSAYKGTTSLDQIRTWAGSAMSFDPNQYRAAHLNLLNKIQ